MNQSSKIAALASGLSLLVVAALAQTSTTSSTTTSSSSTPSSSQANQPSIGAPTAAPNGNSNVNSSATTSPSSSTTTSSSTTNPDAATATSNSTTITPNSTDSTVRTDTTIRSADPTRSSVPTAADATTTATNADVAGSEVDRLGADAPRFKALDTDGDNRISRSEFTLASSRALQGDTNLATAQTKTATSVSDQPNTIVTFTQLDTNKDGFLSPDELAAQHNTKMTK